jgi:hypothetical protein
VKSYDQNAARISAGPLVGCRASVDIVLIGGVT